MKMWHRAGYIVLAVFFIAPPSNWLFLGAAIGLLFVAFMFPDAKEEE